MNIRTPASFAVPSACMCAVAAASAVTPSDVGTSSSDPKWYCCSAAVVSGPAMSSVTPTRNSWPTRCASVSRPNTWAAQETDGVGDADGGGDAVVGEVVTADGLSDEADGLSAGLEEGEL